MRFCIFFVHTTTPTLVESGLKALRLSQTASCWIQQPTRRLLSSFTGSNWNVGGTCYSLTTTGDNVPVTATSATRATQHRDAELASFDSSTMSSTSMTTFSPLTATLLTASVMTTGILCCNRCYCRSYKRHTFHCISYVWFGKAGSQPATARMAALVAFEWRFV